MGKSHRDNHKARTNRGSAAFEKKAKRREEKKIQCNICGTASRPEKIINGLCPICIEKYGSA